MSEAPPYFPYDFAPPILSDLISSPTEKPTIPSDFSVEPGPSKSSAVPDAETDDKDVKPTGPQRSTAGCLTCRRRKVKCDERRPVCAKCTIKHRECVWPDPGSSSARRQSNAKKRSSSTSMDGFMPPPPIKKPYMAAPSRLPSIAPLPVATVSPDTINPFNLHADTSPATDLSMWMQPLDTQDADPEQTTSAPLLHPLPSFEDIASWTFPANPPSSSRLYVPPDFLPKSLILEPGRQRTSLLPPRQRARMMADPGFLQPYFPSVDERIVMRHYLLYTVHIIVAFECERNPWNPWVKIHAPLCFAHLPGVAPACDALRAAVLAIGAVHLRHIHCPKDKAGASKVARGSISKVLDLVRQVIDAQTPTRPLENQDIEFIMAALLSCTIASSLAADGAWDQLLSSVVDFIDRLGGAANLLRDSPRDKMSPLRFCCEQLAIRDVFGCFSTELPPRILDTAFKPWFFEAEAWSQSDDEWESVERMFGISRGMIDVMARACALIAKVQSTGQTLPEESAGIRSWGISTREEVSLRLPERAVARLSSGSTESNERSTADEKPARTRDSLLEETGGLIAELNVWDQASNFVPVHPRTQYANHAYRHAIRIRLLREVFGATRRDKRVQNSAKVILELATEVVAKFGKVTWFTWPVVIAGFHLLSSDPLRKVVSTLLSEFRRYACFDAGAALDLLKEFWREEEEMASIGTTPTQAVARLTSKPFLD